MDQREHDVEEDLKSILRTRLALTEKIQSLEQHVEHTVRGTKETAMDTMEAAKHKALQWVTSTTGRLISFEMLRRRPSIIAGGLMGMGLLAIWMTQRKQHGRSGVYPYYPPRAEGADVLIQEERAGVYPSHTPRAEGAEALSQEDGSRQRSPELNPIGKTRRNETGETCSSSLPQQVSEFLHGLKGEVAHERARLQQAALQIGRSFARDMIHIAGQSLVSLMDQLSTRSRARNRQDQPRGGYSHLTGRSV
jgi:hypothetical protein